MLGAAAVIDRHLRQLWRADPARVDQPVENRLEITLLKMQPVDADSRDRPFNAMFEKRDKRVWPKMAMSEGAGTDNGGVIGRKMAEIRRQVCDHQAAIVAFFIRFDDHFWRDIDAVDDPAVLPCNYSAGNKSGAAPYIKDRPLGQDQPVKCRCDGERVDIAKAVGKAVVVMLCKITVIQNVVIRRFKRIGTSEKRCAGIRFRISAHKAPLTRR